MRCFKYAVLPSRSRGAVPEACVNHNRNLHCSSCSRHHVCRRLLQNKVIHFFKFVISFLILLLCLLCILSLIRVIAGLSIQPRVLPAFPNSWIDHCDVAFLLPSRKQRKKLQDRLRQSVRNERSAMPGMANGPQMHSQAPESIQLANVRALPRCRAASRLPNQPHAPSSAFHLLWNKLHNNWFY